MSTSIVRERQAPLVEIYREAPPQALVHKQARTVTVPADDPFHVAVSVDGPYPSVVEQL